MSPEKDLNVRIEHLKLVTKAEEVLEKITNKKHR